MGKVVVHMAYINDATRIMRQVAEGSLTDADLVNVSDNTLARVSILLQVMHIREHADMRDDHTEQQERYTTPATTPMMIEESPTGTLRSQFDQHPTDWAGLTARLQESGQRISQIPDAGVYKRSAEAAARRVSTWPDWKRKPPTAPIPDSQRPSHVVEQEHAEHLRRVGLNAPRTDSDNPLDGWTDAVEQARDQRRTWAQADRDALVAIHGAEHIAVEPRDDAERAALEAVKGIEHLTPEQKQLVLDGIRQGNKPVPDDDYGTEAALAAFGHARPSKTEIARLNYLRSLLNPLEDPQDIQPSLTRAQEQEIALEVLAQSEAPAPFSWRKGVEAFLTGYSDESKRMLAEQSTQGEADVPTVEHTTEYEESRIAAKQWFDSQREERERLAAQPAREYDDMYRWARDPVEAHRLAEIARARSEETTPE